MRRLSLSLGFAATLLLNGACGGGSVPTLKIRNSGMAPTLMVGDTVVVAHREAKRGDIVLFHPTEWGLKGDYIKRVIGLGGDKVACQSVSGKVTVNGQPLTESYLPTGDKPCVGQPFSVKVPPGYVWLLGDNRQGSSDSRFWIPVGHEGAIAVGHLGGVVERIVTPKARATRVS